MCLVLPFIGISQEKSEMKKISGGTFVPLYGSDSSGVIVEDFLLDVYPVTNQQYITFVKQNPKWKRSKVLRLFADKNYLSKWEGDTNLGVNVSRLNPRQQQFPGMPLKIIALAKVKDCLQ